MYFTARTFYCRVITVVLWLPVTDWLVFSLWEWGVPFPDYTDVYTKVSALCDWIVINAGLYNISAVINWMKSIPGLQTIPLTFIATYPNN
jgi:hypothetical protein